MPRFPACGSRLRRLRGGRVKIVPREIRLEMVVGCLEIGHIIYSLSRGLPGSFLNV